MPASAPATVRAWECFQKAGSLRASGKGPRSESLLITSAPDGRIPAPGRHQPMTKSDHHRSTTSRPGASHPLPTTVWTPALNEPSGLSTPGGVLPGWALDKIRAEFTHRPDHPPARLIKIHMRDTEPGMDTRTRVTYIAAPADRKAPLYQAFGLTLTYNMKKRVVTVESRPASVYVKS